MIKIDTIGVWGFEGSLRGCRMPYESFDKSDSGKCPENCARCIYGSEESYDSEDENLKDEVWYSCIEDNPNLPYSIGEADMALCKKLIKAGSEHRKFLRMIHVQADVVAPRYWWAEMDKYKYVEANSSSTMHLITKRHVTGEDFSIDNHEHPSEAMKSVIFEINTMIDEYNSSRWDAKEKETFFLHIKQILPESYNQLRTIDTNYECLLNIYHQRHAHRLPEWHTFCDWCLCLPYFKEFIGVLNGKN